MKTTMMMVLLALLPAVSAIAEDEVPPNFRIAVEDRNQQ